MRSPNLSWIFYYVAPFWMQMVLKAFAVKFRTILSIFCKKIRRKCQSKRSSVIGCPGPWQLDVFLRFAMCCSFETRKLQVRKQPKPRPNSDSLIQVKLAESCRNIWVNFFVPHRTQPLIYFWLIAHAASQLSHCWRKNAPHAKKTVCFVLFTHKLSRNCRYWHKIKSIVSFTKNFTSR